MVPSYIVIVIFHNTEDVNNLTHKLNQFKVYSTPAVVFSFKDSKDHHFHRQRHCNYYTSSQNHPLSSLLNYGHLQNFVIIIIRRNAYRSGIHQLNLHFCPLTHSVPPTIHLSLNYSCIGPLF